MSDNGSGGNDRAPIVFLRDGTPVRVRLVGGKCEGDISGEGHYGYRKTMPDADEPTVYFEQVDEPGAHSLDTDTDQ